MKLLVLYEHPDLNKTAQSKFCTYLQNMLGTCERQQRFGMRTKTDALSTMLNFVECYTDDGVIQVQPLRDSRLESGKDTVGFELLDDLPNEGVTSVYKAVYLPRGAGFCLDYFLNQYLKAQPSEFDVSIVEGLDTEQWEMISQQIQATVLWLGGTCEIFSDNGKSAFRVKLSDWEKVRIYTEKELASLCFSIEKHITNIGYPRGSSRGIMWERYLELKHSIEELSLLKKQGFTCELKWVGFSIRFTKANSIPTQRLGYIDFSERGLDDLKALYDGLCEVCAASMS